MNEQNAPQGHSDEVIDVQMLIMERDQARARADEFARSRRDYAVRAVQLQEALSNAYALIREALSSPANGVVLTTESDRIRDLENENAYLQDMNKMLETKVEANRSVLRTRIEAALKQLRVHSANKIDHEMRWSASDLATDLAILLENK